MTEYELTPAAQNRYDGDMPDASPQEQPVEQPKQQEQQASEEYILPGPVSEAAQSLYRNAKKNAETGDEPVEAQTDIGKISADKVKNEGQKNYTRNELMKVAQTIQGKTDSGAVMIDAEFVSAAANVLLKNIDSDVANHKVNQALKEEFERNNIPDQAAKVAKLIKSRGPDGEFQNDEESTQRKQFILGQAEVVAKLAKAIANYYERAKLSKEYDDPFRQVVSFEELMTKFNITLDDDRFRPGGEFELMDVREYTDEFGRELSEETAHPENFLRWVTERAWFYHDFDPMANIDLFQGMYLVAGSRKLSMYEMLVDFNAYFAHRVATNGQLKILQEDMYRAKDKGNFVYEPEWEALGADDERGGKTIGHFTKFRNPETGELTEAYVDNKPEEDEGRRRSVLSVYYYKSDEARRRSEKTPVIAQLANKEAWETQKRPEYEKAQEEIMYQLWLMTKNHNADVAYRQKGMPSEKPLSETLTEIYGDNIWTRTRRRLLGILDMPATTYRGDVDKNGRPINEAALKWKGEYKGQGSVGKAYQRSLAAYYHISEANAVFEGYTTDDVSGESFNPFYEVLRKEGVNGAEIFYKRLIQRTLFEDKKFGYVHDGYDKDQKEDKEDSSWNNSEIEVEFFNILNTTRIPRAGAKEGEKTERKRLEWEKADFVDFMTLSKQEFLTKMKSRFISSENIDAAFTILEEKYAEKDAEGNPNKKADSARLTKLRELKADMASGSEKRRDAFLDSLRSNVKKFGGKIDDKYEKMEAKYKGGSQDGLAGFAVAVFTRAYPSEFVPDINPFINIRYGLEARERMRGAMRDALSFTEKLDDFDSKWAEEWAYTFTFHTGISARNDMQGIGHDAWSKIINTEYYRLRQSGGGNYPGNLDNLYGIHRLGTDFWQGLKVQEDGSSAYEKTLYEILVGLEKRNGKYTFNVNKDVKSFEFAGNAMRQFYADHVSHAIDLFVDITQKQEFNLDKIIQLDNFGKLTWNNEEMQKLIDSTWKHLRYGFDNNGFLYDNVHYGWLYDETINKDGAVTRTPHFAFKTLRELMFSKKVREMDMYNRKDVSGWDGRKDDVYHGKMARNVFAYLIAAQLREHTRNNGGYRTYSADEVATISQAFMQYAARVMKGEDGETVVLSGFFTPEEIMRILVAAHSILWMLYAKEYGLSFGGGFLFGFLEAFGLIMKQIGAGIKL